MNRSLLLVALTLTMATTKTLAADAQKHTFQIGPDSFLLDGKPFVIRCGEVHFPRVPREYWRDRLKMCKAMGLNTVCVYLFWNFHEWEQGKYDWSGAADAAEFCRLAKEEGLWVILRPGPYSCAEWEMGGLPWWLLKNDDIKLRSTDPKFLEPAKKYLKEVGRVLGPQQITKGGPLLMVQVENEYGSFGNDAKYMGELRQALIDGGFDVPLFACNPPNAIKNGYRDDLFQVVNFGPGGAEKSFEELKKFQKTGPLMNGEYYPAWFDMWGRKHRTSPSEPIVKDLDEMLGQGRSFSIYMAHGGTSFGLWSGADRPFSPDTSSYDYDAPISEAGWRTPKFDAIREVISKHLAPGEKLPDAPAPNPVIALAPFALAESAPLMANLPAPQHKDVPPTMEFLGQTRGMTLYRTQLPAGPAGPLTVKEAHDFAWVFLDGKQVGTMDRRSKKFRVQLPERSKPAQLDILVEAMGRVNFGQEVFDRKGLHTPIAFDGKELKGWDIFSFPLDAKQLAALKWTKGQTKGPAFWRGSFDVSEPGDTFLDVRNWGKGVVWVNGHCLGRYWNIGPTQTMYLPGPWLKKGRNEIVVLDVLGPQKPELAGLEKPVLDELRPELDFSRKQWATGNFDTSGIEASAQGAFTADTKMQEARFASPAKGRYLCVEAVSSVDGKPFASAAEIDALGPKGEPLSKSAWKILWASSEETNYLAGDAENILDGQPNSFWHTDNAGATPPKHPHRVVIDLGESREIAGIRYLPRSGVPKEDGGIKDYRVYVSDQPFGLTPPKP